MNESWWGLRLDVLFSCLETQIRGGPLLQIIAKNDLVSSATSYAEELEYAT